MAWPKGKPRKPKNMADTPPAGEGSPVIPEGAVPLAVSAPIKDRVRVKICTKRRPWYDDKPREFAEVVMMDRDMAKRFEGLMFGVILDV